jgi:hypothetical protein
VKLDRIGALNRPYYQVPVTLEQPSGDPVDPSGLIVQFAFPAVGVAPVDADWYDGEWVYWVKSGRWEARILVGPGGAVAPSGNRDAWCSVEATPQRIREIVGRVQFD